MQESSQSKHFPLLFHTHCKSPVFLRDLYVGSFTRCFVETYKWNMTRSASLTYITSSLITGLSVLWSGGASTLRRGGVLRQVAATSQPMWLGQSWPLPVNLCFPLNAFCCLSVHSLPARWLSSLLGSPSYTPPRQAQDQIFSSEWPQLWPEHFPGISRSKTIHV